MKKVFILSCTLGLFLTGCWTVSETEYPEVSVPEGKGIRVKLKDYRTGVYNYRAVEGHESMSATEEDPPLIGQELAAQPDMSWRLQFTASGRLVTRAVAELKRKGYIVDTKNPQYVIDVRFTGPELPDNDVLRQIGYGLCTLLTAENMVVTWSAHLKVHDAVSDNVLYEKTLEQTYDVTVWGPIPVGSPGCCEKISGAGANSWALTALADRALEDATAFIAGRAK